MREAKETSTTPGWPVMDDTSTGHASTVDVVFAKKTGPVGEAGRTCEHAHKHKPTDRVQLC